MGLTYRSLVRRGRSPNVALTAVMRKLIIVANTLIAENRPWEARMLEASDQVATRLSSVETPPAAA